MLLLCSSPKARLLEALIAFSPCARKPLGAKVAGTGKTSMDPDDQTWTKDTRGRKLAIDA
jgi:hypothetical protein